MPKDNGIDRKLSERFSALVYNVLLPPFFALSGINSNITGLKSGLAWAYVITVVLVAFVSKVAASTVAARTVGIKMRESLTIGVLMSCKGIVEIIALVS